MKLILTVVSFLVTVGCMPVRVVDYQKDASNTNIRKFKTYSFYTIDAPETKGPFFEANLNLLKSAFDSEMKKLGITHEEVNGELLINFGISVEEKVQTRETDFRTDGGMQYMGQRNYHWESQEVIVNRYKEGTIVIDFIDASNNKLVWQGAVAGTISDNRKKTEARINTAIKSLFKKIPE